MNLIFHQLRNDMRAFRWMLLLWFAFLGLELDKETGSLGTMGYHPGGFSNNLITMGVLTFILWVLFLLLPSLVVLADSPAKTDGFLNARPMPARCLYLAKALFVLLLVVMPVVVLEGLHLSIKGLPTWFVFHGALERAVFALLIAAIAGGFAGLWRDGKQWSGALVGAALGFVLWVIIVSSLYKYFPIYPIHEIITVTSFLVRLFFFAMGILLLVCLSKHYRWRIPARGLGLFCIYTLSMQVAARLPLDFFPARGADPAAMAKLAGSYSIQAPLPAVDISLGYKPESNNVRLVSVGITPGFDGLPEDCSIEWAGQRLHSELVFNSGKVVAYEKSEAPRAFSFESNVRPRELEIFSSLLGSDVRFLGGSTPPVAQEHPSAGEFDLAPNDALLAEPARVKADLTGRVFRWQKVAVLPLTPGATVKDSLGQWRVIGVQVQPGNGFQVGIQRDQMVLSMTEDPRLKSAPGYRAFSDYQFILYDAGKTLAQLPSNQVWPDSPSSQGTLTAYPSRFANIPFWNNGVFAGLGGQDAKDLQLVIFEKVYLGSLDKQWESPAFVAGDFLSKQSGETKSEQMTPAEFERRLALIAPPKTTSRLEVGRYLGEVLSLVSAKPQPLLADHPLRESLSKRVPDSLPVFIDGLGMTTGNSHELLFSLILHGATENQKGQIISALRARPELAGIILERGWTEEARGSLYQLLQRLKPLPREALQALALYEDPATYPRLLAELEAEPSLELYEILHALPGMGPQLDQAVARIWKERDRSTSEQIIQGPLAVAMRHGKREALEEAYRLFNQIKPDFRVYGSRLVSALQDNIVGAKNPEWLAKHRPEDFKYDPFLRRFVLKEASAANLLLKSSRRRKETLTSSVVAPIELQNLSLTSNATTEEILKPLLNKVS